MKMARNYESAEQWVISVLRRRGPIMRRSALLGLLRHLGGVREINPILHRLQRRGIIEQYSEAVQCQRRVEHQKMVALVVDDELEQMLG
jgi:hypothetical protein